MELTRIADHVARGADPTDEQFRLLVSSVTEYAIYLLDTSGRVASWNAGAERIKGYRAGEVTGRHFSLFYTAEDRAAGKPELVLGWRRAMAGSKARWRVRKDGRRFWPRSRSRPCATRGRAERLRQGDARHARAAHSARAGAALRGHVRQRPNGISVADPPALSRPNAVPAIGRYSEAELRTKTVFDSPIEDVAESWRSFQMILHGEADRLEFDNRYMRKDGRSSGVPSPRPACDVHGK